MCKADKARRGLLKLGLALNAAFLCCGSGAQAAPPFQIHERGPRALAAALLLVESNYAVPITYEDPPYASAAEIGLSPSGQQLVPRDGTVDIEFSGAEGVAEVIERVLAAYNRPGNPGDFEFTSVQGWFHIYPRRYLSVEGDFIPGRSIFNSAVSLTASDTSGMKLLESLCSQITTTLPPDVKLVVGAVPVNYFSGRIKQFASGDTTAREAVKQIVLMTGVRMSWQIFFDPKVKWYVLNIHVIAPKL